MKFLKSKPTILALSLMSVFATSQLQADSNFYIGAAVTQSYVDETGLDDDDTGGKFFIGYQFNNYFAIEGSYYDFGEFNDSGNEFALDGYDLGVVGILPVSNRVSLFGKVGVHEWDAEASGAASGLTLGASGSDVFFGVGIDYDISNRWTIRGEIEHYEVEDIDVDVASVGISFNF